MDALCTQAAAELTTFRTSQSAIGHFRNRLNGWSRPGIKFAGVGGDLEQGFEQAFASLAYAYLRDKAPRLLDYVVGFQLVERNEDNTKAVGVFGVKIGPAWYYAPMFFLNGDLKGHELLWIKKSDMFVPLKENWINYLMSKQSTSMGEPAGTNMESDLGVIAPTLRRLGRTPPPGLKTGAYQPNIAEWAMPALPMLAAAKLALEDNPKFFEKHAELADRMDLRQALLSHVDMLRGAYQVYEDYPGLKHAFDKFYGADLFPKLAAELHKMASVQANSLIPETPAWLGHLPKTAEVSLWEAHKVEHPCKTGMLKIVTAADVEKTEPSTEEDADLRQKLTSDPVIIKDLRDAESISVAYNTQTPLQYTNPSDTGIYDLLSRPSKVDECLIINYPFSGRGSESCATCVRLDDPRNWINAHATRLWIRNKDTGAGTSDWRDWYKNLPGDKRLTAGNTYVAVTATGQGSVPFFIHEKLEAGKYRVRYHDGCSLGRAPGILNTAMEIGNDYYPPRHDSWNSLLQVNDKTGTAFRAVNGTLMVPKEAKFVRVSPRYKPPKDEDSDKLPPMAGGSSCCGDCSSDNPPLDPGDILDVQMSLYEKTAQLKVVHAGCEFAFSGPRGSERFSPTNALVSLVRDHGLAEATARELLKTAEERREFTVRIAYAEPYRKFAYAPSMPDPIYGSDPLYGSAQTQFMQEDELAVPGMQPNPSDASLYDPMLVPDASALQAAQMAGNRGQKEVFDTAILAGLVKTVRQDALVDRFLGDLMRALDKLGRILFMFYWHQEDFQDRYGKSDLPELEDAVRNSFDSLGDLVLFLKQKSVEPENDLRFGAPDISDVARN